MRFLYSWGYQDYGFLGCETAQLDYSIIVSEEPVASIFRIEDLGDNFF
jgi:hypothetical protein